MVAVLDTGAHHSLQCMEIWGGSDAVNQSISTPGLDLWVYSQPFEQAQGGGDVHYVSLCGAGLITRFMLADVSGHGESVADTAQSLRDLMRRNINSKSHAKLVKDLNQQFTEFAKLRRFATAIVATYLADKDLLTICNAGHPHPLWFNQMAREWEYVSLHDMEDPESLSNLPLGIDNSTAYPQRDLALGRGDLLLFYTDAFTEASNPAGEMLGERGFLELVRGINESDPATMAQQILERIDEYRGGKPAHDDASLLLLHHNAHGPTRLSIREKLDVYAKFFGLKSI